MQGFQNVSIETWIRGAKFNLKIPIHSGDINKKQTFYKWNAQPSEIKKVKCNGRKLNGSIREHFSKPIS